MLFKEAVTAAAAAGRASSRFPARRGTSTGGGGCVGGGNPDTNSMAGCRSSRLDVSGSCRPELPISGPSRRFNWSPKLQEVCRVGDTSTGSSIRGGSQAHRYWNLKTPASSQAHFIACHCEYPESTGGLAPRQDDPAWATDSMLSSVFGRLRFGQLLIG